MGATKLSQKVGMIAANISIFKNGKAKATWSSTLEAVWKVWSASLVIFYKKCKEGVGASNAASRQPPKGPVGWPMLFMDDS